MKLHDVAVIAGLLFSGAASAATEFQDQVPMELIRLNPFYKYYQTLPNGFPLVPLPANPGLSVVGSVSTGSSTQTVLRSVRPQAESRAMLAAAYAAQGWIDFVETQDRLYLCHDTAGFVDFRFVDSARGEHRIYASQSWFVRELPLDFTCAEYIERINTGNLGDPVLRFVMQQTPELDVPEGYSKPFGGSSSNAGSGNWPWFEMNNDDIITEARDVDADELHEHFAAQLRAQGWTNDSSDAGAFSATSVWRKTAPLPAVGNSAARDIGFTLMFMLLHVGDGEWQMTARTRVNLSLAELGLTNL